MIIDHTHPEYKAARQRIGKHGYNGAYYYSFEIVRNIIPAVDTDRNWITIKAGEQGADHSICFVHNNVTFEETYAYMKKYDDVIYVVGLMDMIERAEKFGKTIYIPLSVDCKRVERFRTEKTKDMAIAGRDAEKWRELYNLPEDADALGLMPRPTLLREMAKYRRVYAIGRTAIEATILGCEVLPFHPRFPNPNMWWVVDNNYAAQMLQARLDEIDGRGIYQWGVV